MTTPYEYTEFETDEDKLTRLASELEQTFSQFADLFCRLAHNNNIAYLRIEPSYQSWDTARVPAMQIEVSYAMKGDQSYSGQSLKATDFNTLFEELAHRAQFQTQESQKAKQREALVIEQRRAIEHKQAIDDGVDF